MNIKKILIGTVAGALMFGSLATGVFASETIYNNIPSLIPGNVASQAYEATSTSEYGGQVQFSGTSRTNPTVTVLMSSWGCQSGSWDKNNCLTTQGATFIEPITLNIYNVGTNNTPGTKIATVTKTFDIPYRPSSDNINCKNADLGKWYSSIDNKCYNGFATPIVFNLNGVTLPDKVIIGVAYNTSDYGYAPYGTSTPCHSSAGGCGYDSLNVGTNPTPTNGTALPTVDDAYLNSSWSGAYCPSDTTTGTFRLDMGCWTGFLPAFKIEASMPTPLTKEQCKNNGWKKFADNNGISFKNQGDCVSYVSTRYKTFTAGDSLYYNCSTVCDSLYGTGGISFTWDKVTGNIISGKWDEVVPPTSGTIYHNIITAGTVSGNNVNLTFDRTDPNVNHFTFSGTLVDNILSGQMAGPYYFTATGN